MGYQRHFEAVALFLLSASSLIAAPTTIQFNTESDLPYFESGLSFSTVGGPPDVAPMSIVSGALRSASFFSEVDQHTRVSSPVPFTLKSLDYFVTFSSLVSPWRFESSTGAVVLPDHQGSPVQTIDFSTMQGWSNISHFDVIFEAPNVRHGIFVDNVVVEFVPEPSTIALGVVGLLAAALRRGGL